MTLLKNPVASVSGQRPLIRTSIYKRRAPRMSELGAAIRQADGNYFELSTASSIATTTTTIASNESATINSSSSSRSSMSNNNNNLLAATNQTEATLEEGLQTDYHSNEFGQQPTLHQATSLMSIDTSSPSSPPPGQVRKGSIGSVGPSRRNRNNNKNNKINNNNNKENNDNNESIKTRSRFLFPPVTRFRRNSGGSINSVGFINGSSSLGVDGLHLPPRPKLQRQQQIQSNPYPLLELRQPVTSSQQQQQQQHYHQFLGVGIKSHSRHNDSTFRERIRYLELLFKITGTVRATESLIINSIQRVIMSCIGLYGVASALLELRKGLKRDITGKSAESYALEFGPAVMSFATNISNFWPCIVNYHYFELILNKKCHIVDDKRFKRSLFVACFYVFYSDMGPMIVTVLKARGEWRKLRPLKVIYDLVSFHILSANFTAIYLLMFLLTTSMSSRIRQCIENRRRYSLATILETMTQIRDILLLVRQVMSLTFLVSYIHTATLLARCFYVIYDAVQTGNLFLAIYPLHSYSVLLFYMVISTYGYNAIHSDTRLLVRLIEQDRIIGAGNANKELVEQEEEQEEQQQPPHQQHHHHHHQRRYLHQYLQPNDTTRVLNDQEQPLSPVAQESTAVNHRHQDEFKEVLVDGGIQSSSKSLSDQPLPRLSTNSNQNNQINQSLMSAMSSNEKLNQQQPQQPQQPQQSQQPQQPQQPQRQPLRQLSQQHQHIQNLHQQPSLPSPLLSDTGGSSKPHMVHSPSAASVISRRYSIFCFSGHSDIPDASAGLVAASAPIDNSEMDSGLGAINATTTTTTTTTNNNNNNIGANNRSSSFRSQQSTTTTRRSTTDLGAGNESPELGSNCSSRSSSTMADDLFFTVYEEPMRMVAHSEVILLRRLAKEICRLWPSDWVKPDAKNQISLVVLVITLVTTIIQLSAVAQRRDQKNAAGEWPASVEEAIG